MLAAPFVNSLLTSLKKLQRGIAPQYICGNLKIIGKMKKALKIGGLSAIILLYLYYIHEHLGAGGLLLSIIFLALIFFPKDNNNKPNNFA